MSVGILVDDSILYYHHGVRCLVFSLYNNIIKRGIAVDLIFMLNEGFYVLKPSSSELENNFFSENQIIGNTKSKIIKKLKPSLLDSISTSKTIKINLKNALKISQEKQYSELIISAPWLCDGRPFLYAPSIKMIAHDTIPIHYYFNNPDPNYLAFANIHHTGYSYAALKDGFICNSESTYNDLERHGYAYEGVQVEILKALMPPGLNDISDDQLLASKRGDTAVLLAPFDKRKGLALMPQILKNSGIKKLNIIGGIRCSLEMVKTFFNDLDIEDVVWYANASFETKKKLCLESKVLLFPSFNEGLGFPLIEAYGFGCRCLAFDHLSTGILLDQDKMSTVEDFKEELSERKLAEHDPIFYRRHIESIVQI